MSDRLVKFISFTIEGEGWFTVTWRFGRKARQWQLRHPRMVEVIA